MCAGCTGSDGYSSGSDFRTRLVELKYDGCADQSEYASIAGCFSDVALRTGPQFTPCFALPQFPTLVNPVGGATGVQYARRSADGIAGHVTQKSPVFCNTGLSLSFNDGRNCRITTSSRSGIRAARID
jgi:hypothetical protein